MRAGLVTFLHLRNNVNAILTFLLVLIFNVFTLKMQIQLKDCKIKFYFALKKMLP